MIRVNPEKCSGCRRCEVDCSFFHSGKVGRSGSRIRVVKIEEIGLDFPVVCQQCRERYCTRCPESAVAVGPQGQIIVSPTLCNGCGRCEALCPIGAVELFEEIPYVCDLCGGSPRCIPQCGFGAIFDDGPAENVSLKTYKQKSRGLSPEEKRVRFALGETAQMASIKRNE